MKFYTADAKEYRGPWFWNPTMKIGFATDGDPEEYMHSVSGKADCELSYWNIEETASQPEIKRIARCPDLDYITLAEYMDD